MVVVSFAAAGLLAGGVGRKAGSAAACAGR